LLELLYAPIVSAIGNVVDFMVGTSEFIGIALGFAASLVEEPAQGACQPDEPISHLLQSGTGKVGKHQPMG